MKITIRASLVVAILLSCHFLAAQTAHGVVIGGFDLSRGGVGSLSDAPENAPFRDLIEVIAPSAVFTSTSELTPAYLSTIDVLLLAANTGSTTTISPLSAAEQTAMFNFVAGGGNLGVLTEREPQGGPGGDASRESLLDPFGMDTSGDYLAPAATFTNPNHPVADGPFGAITQFAIDAAGGYTDLGPYATALATEDFTDVPVLAVIERNVIAPGSGRALFLADGHTDAFAAFNFGELWGNGYAYLVPEPSSATLAIAGCLACSCLLVRRGLRAARR
jgi:hypothetical protein